MSNLVFFGALGVAQIKCLTALFVLYDNSNMVLFSLSL